MVHKIDLGSRKRAALAGFHECEYRTLKEVERDLLIEREREKAHRDVVMIFRVIGITISVFSCLFALAFFYLIAGWLGILLFLGFIVIISMASTLFNHYIMRFLSYHKESIISILNIFLYSILAVYAICVFTYWVLGVNLI